MDTLSLPSSGLKLSQLPVSRSIDPYKRDKIPQAVILDLAQDELDRLLKSCRAGGDVDVAANLGARSMIEMITKTAGGKQDRQEIPTKTLEKSLALCENGFLYRIDETSEQASLQSRLDLRTLQKRSNNDGQDAGLLALTKGLSDANAQKRSQRTTLADPNASKRKRPFKSSMVASFGGLKGHRENLFGHSKQSSLSTSPLLGGRSPLTLNSEKDKKKARLEEAKKRALIHLLAVRPASESQIAKSLCCPLSDIQHLIRKHGQPSRADSTKFELNDLGYKNIDPWSFGYSEEDRSLAIDRAIEAFDRKRLGKTDKAWDILLPKSERGKGKGIGLSKLVKKLLTADSHAQPAKTTDSRSTPVPEINISEAGSPPHNKPTSSEMSRKRSSSDSANGDAQERTAKRAKQGVDPREKRLFQSASQREREKAKERAKEMKRLESKAAPSVASSPRDGAKKLASSRTIVAAAASSASAPAKVKSSEFVTESDDEEADAVVKKAQAAQSPKPAANKASSKPAAKPSLAAKSATGPKSSSTVTSGLAATTAAATSNSSDRSKTLNGRSMDKASPGKSERPSKPSAWDFSANKKPATGTLNRPSAKTAAPSSRPSTPSGGPIVQQRGRVKATGANAVSRTSGAPSTAASSSSAAMARTGSNAGSASAKPVSRPAEKPASQRTDLMRKLDSAKRPSGSSDPRGARPSSVKASASSSSSSSARPSAYISSPVRSSEMSRSQPMSKTFSHQRKSSQPLQPSPLAASPPINLADIDETARGNRASLANKTLPKKAVTTTGTERVESSSSGAGSSSNASNSNATRTAKRKIDDTDLKSSKAGALSTATVQSSSSSSAGAERPAKRREMGTAASHSNGAGQPKAAPARQRDGSSTLKARRYSQEDSGSSGGSGSGSGSGSNGNSGGAANGNKSHSPSPASSTIGSTSTKDTSLSLHSSGASKDKNSTDAKPVNGVKGGSSASGGVQPKSNGPSGTTATVNDSSKFNGIKHSELERLSRFEEQREQYNRKQREVAAMEHPPIEKVRELNRLFHSLETQKKVLAAL